MSSINQANPTSFADSLRGFAAMIRSGAMTADDHEMVAKKFVAAADLIDEMTKRYGPPS